MAIVALVSVEAAVSVSVIPLSMATAFPVPLLYAVLPPLVVNTGPGKWKLVALIAPIPIKPVIVWPFAAVTRKESMS